MIPMNNTNSFVKFFDNKVLKKERELIDSWDYEICNQYGMDCLFVSQKAKFPTIKKSLPLKYPKETSRPDQNDLFFHAYGEISRPEYNEPFQTRVYVQFTEDLFAINGFGLNQDLTTTLIFNKTSFALDGALAMADNQTINRHFKFNMEVDGKNKYAIVNYNSKNIHFKAKFNWQKALEKMVEGELAEIDVDPENLVKPDILNTFKRRYSASKFVETCKLFFKCDDKKFNRLTGNYKISGTCIANFVVKNPWKAYSKFLNRITPSVGDLVLLHGIDDNIIKLEIMEIESENKTQQGISPLLGSYSFKCTAKPYIADNNASAMHDPITAPTDINAKKLIIQTVLNHDASKITDHISTYEKLYTDEMGFDFTEDDIYGGYDLEPPNGLSNPPAVPVKHIPINSNERTSYKWNYFEDKNVEIKDENGKTIATYTPDVLYTYLKNLMDTNYTDYLIEHWGIDVISVDYSALDFNNKLKAHYWYKCMALNVPLWYNTHEISTVTKHNSEQEEYEITVVSAYTEADRRLHCLQTSPSSQDMFEKFIDDNPEFFAFTNKAAYDGIPTKYEIPIIAPCCYDEYMNLINDKSDEVSIEISSSNVYELSSFLEVSAIRDDIEYFYPDRVERYVKNPKHKYDVITDLYDIEQYNVGSSDFEEVVKTTTPQYKEWKKINIKKVNGPLIEIFRFENNDNTRLATNGKKLFFETTYDNELYRTEISSIELNTEITGEFSKEYKGLSVPLSGKMNWLEADEHGVYFNTAYGTRTKLYGDKKIDEEPFTHLNYENDISSPRDSFILTFKNSKFYFTVQPTEDGPFSLKLCH
jgi:hypothetical protein